ncbi:Glutamate receptor [Pseudolycoriella hygida]|uniref:Glutamate receptor n=1 Tax=Pseudolycoriella hygida TaxID=35572 RepID=A0A9Q0MMP4_9DIPT|nr:Glutamate receptor [Pseudolycoriella hygida]
MSRVSVCFVLITIIYCEGVNTTNDSESDVDRFFGTHIDSKNQLIFRTVSILCKFQPNLVHIYYDGALKTNVAEKLILLMSNCSSLMIVRYKRAEKQIKQANDDGVKIFLLNVISSTNDLNLSYIRNNSGDKHTSHFIILIENDDAVKESSMQKIFRAFWEYSLLKVLIVFWKNDFNIFTYTPFGNDFLIKIPSNASSYEELFWDKTRDLNQHPFRVSLFPEKTRAIFNTNGKFSGTDGYLTDVMIEKLNAKLVLLPPTDGYDIGEFLKNGSSTGSLNQILTRFVDVSFNTRFLRLAQFQGKVQITFTNGRDDICILVAKAGFASNFYNIFRAFSTTVWMFTLISLLSAPISFFGVYRTGSKRPTVKNIFFNFYSWHLAQPILHLPERWSSKILIAFWIIYCLLINSSYEGNLTSNLVLRPTLPEINTIRQLEQSSYQILTFGRYVDLLQNFLNQTGTYNKLKKRIRGISAEDLDRHIQQNDVRYAYANKYHINQYISRNKLHIINGIPVYNHMVECPVPYLVAYAVGYGSPYLYRINTILRRTQESGFISYWDQKNEQSSGGAKKSEGGPVPLTVDHVLSAFYILGVGLVIATFCLVIELFEAKVKSTNWYKNNNKVSKNR